MEEVNDKVYYLYLISTDVDLDHDTYDSAIVSAKDEKSACMIHPALGFMTEGEWILRKRFYTSRKDMGDYNGWVNYYTSVKVKLIGLSYKKDTCVILASFNAG